jgi:hypothetical protein
LPEDLQVALRDEQLGNEANGRDEEDLELVAANPLSGRGRHEMTLAGAGEAEAEQVVASANKLRLEEAGQLALLRGRKWRRGRDSNPRAANLDRAEFAWGFPSENPCVIVLCYFSTSLQNCIEMNENEGNNALMAASWRHDVMDMRRSFMGCSRSAHHLTYG